MTRVTSQGPWGIPEAGQAEWPGPGQISLDGRIYEGVPLTNVLKIAAESHKKNAGDTAILDVTDPRDMVNRQVITLGTGRYPLERVYWGTFYEDVTIRGNGVNGTFLAPAVNTQDSLLSLHGSNNVFQDLTLVHTEIPNNGELINQNLSDIASGTTWFINCRLVARAEDTGTDVITLLQTFGNGMTTIFQDCELICDGASGSHPFNVSSGTVRVVGGRIIGKTTDEILTTFATALLTFENLPTWENATQTFTSAFGGTHHGHWQDENGVIQPELATSKALLFMGW